MLNRRAGLLAATALVSVVSSQAATAQDFGYTNNTGTVQAYTNPAGTTVTGAKSAIWANDGGITLTNEGILTGLGTFAGTETLLPDGGVVISSGGSSVNNSGTISGGAFGITTAHFYNQTTMLQEPRAVGTVITNSGTITGQNDDGVRLIGGGSVINGGTISGLVTSFADGISAFPLTGQSHAGQPSLTTVTNNVGGSVSGVRFGVILSGGGTISNAGSMTGGTGGVLVQEATNTLTGKTGSITNSGTLTGTAGYGAGFAGTLTSATLTNTGTITGTTFGVHNGATGGLTMQNQVGSSITGTKIGVLSDTGPITLINAGTIRGNGTVDTAQRDGGVNMGAPNSSVTNSGTISGAGYGVVASAFVSGSLQNLARNTSVTNNVGGIIRGDNNDGVRLEGGGTVTNSGTIEGLVGAGADGVSMLAFSTQDLTGVAQIGSVDNKAGGTITGNRLGILISNGGTVTNAGTVQGNSGAITLQEATLTGKTASVTNSGSLLGGTNAVAFAGTLASSSLTNSGTITGSNGYGVQNFAPGRLTMTNQAGGTITGSRSGVVATSGALTLTNAGTIRGNGTLDNTTDVPDGGVTIQRADSSVTNSGTISGAATGITTGGVLNSATNVIEGLARNTSVSNSGTIRGDNNDGVRLIGGGAVTNSGLIEGLVATGADGISMFQFDTQDRAGQTGIGSVVNSATGEIKGNRFGVILSGGGTITNSGKVSGANGGITIQETASSPGKTATIVNLGTVTGNVFGLQQAGSIASGEFTNSGTITGTATGPVSGAPAGYAIGNLSSGVLTVRNLAGGTLTGGTIGVYANSGAINLINAGTVRGSGTTDTTLNAPGAGVTFNAAGSTVTNSGSIIGTGYGITTATTTAGLRPTGIIVSNSGTIRGEGNDGVRLIAGGTVTNSGLIEGLVGTLADGVSMLTTDTALTASQTSIGTVTNDVGGTIRGNRIGVLLSGGGTVTNAGTIASSGQAAVIIQQDTVETAKVATLTNSGTITGNVSLLAQTNTLTNSGTLTGVVSAGGSVNGASRVTNSGTVTGAVTFAGGDDFYDFVQGATQTGVVDAAAGFDTLTLVSAAGKPAQRLDGSNYINFEKLVQSGQGNGLSLFFSGVQTFSNLGAADGGTVSLDSGTVTSVDVGTGSTATVGSQATVSATTAGATAVAVGGSGGTVNSAGTIQATGERGTAVALTGGTASFANSGTVSASGTGSTAVQASGAASSVSNTGAISNTGANATAVALSGSGATVSSASGATITTAGAGSTAISLTGSSATVQNAQGATITTTGANSVGVAMNASDANVRNNGTLVTTGNNSIGVAVSGQRGRVANTSLFTIRTTGENSDAIKITGTDNSVSNTGAIRVSGAGSAAIHIAAAAGSANSIDNGAAGVIVSADTAILGGDGNESVSNAGVITGSVRLGGGNDTLTLLDGGSISGVVDGGAGTDTLSYVTTAGATLGATTGFETLAKSGTGTLMVDRSAIFNAINVTQGRLQIAEGVGLLGSLTTVGAGARLGGTGRLVGNVIMQGTLAPGNSIGTTSVTGNVTFAPGATYEVEVNSAGAADRLVAAGAVALAGTVTVLAEAGDYAKLTSYAIVQAASVSGQFSGATSSSSALVPYLSYSATGATLTLARSDQAFAAIGATPAQVAIGGAVQALGRGNALYDAVILRPTVADGRAALAALSGEVHASVPTALIDESRLVRGALLGRAGQSGEGYGIWGTAFGTRAESSRSGGIAEIDAARQGVMAGIEGNAGNFRLGLGAGIADSDMRVDERASTADVGTKLVGAFAGFETGKLIGRVAASYAWHDVDTTRRIAFGSFAAAPIASYDGSTRQIAGEIGYKLLDDVVGLEPFAGLALVNTRIDALTETGAAAVTVAKQSRDASFATLGVRLTGEAAMGPATFLPRITAAYIHGWGDLDGTAAMRFGATPAFAQGGARIGGESVSLDGGFDLAFGKSFRFGASYGATLNNDFADHGAKITASFAF